jgi:protein SCO1/2
MKRWRPYALSNARIFIVAALFSVFAGAAEAGLAPDQLTAVGVDPPPGATFPIDAPLLDLDGRETSLGEAIDGRPATIVFVDYTCKTLCSPIVAIVAGALRGSGLRPGDDFRLIAIGFNPKNSADDARRMIDAQIGLTTPLGLATKALRATPAIVQRLTTAVGYRFAYDAEHDLYAHPAAILVAGADGRVSRALSGLALSPEDLRLALVEAGHGAIGKISDQLHLLCYGFDAKIGFYTDRIRLILIATCSLTVLSLALGLAGLSGVFPLSRRPS